MFGALIRVANNIKKLDENRILRGVLSNSSIQQDILSLNTEDQLFEKGIRSDGQSLGEYSPVTIEGSGTFLGKRQKGQRFDHITLKDTGEFYESFRFKNGKDQFVITADAIKEDTDLTREFGKEIIGLSEESLQKVRRWVLPLVQESVRQKIRA